MNLAIVVPRLNEDDVPAAVDQT